MKDIKGYEGLYAVTEDGKIYSYRSKKFLKQKIDRYGYLIVNLSKNKKAKSCKVHRLVANAYIPNPNNYDTVDHIDSDKTNNRVENLQWLDNASNNSKGHCKPIIHLETGKIYVSARECARKLNMNEQCIRRVCNNVYKHTGKHHFKYLDEVDTKEIIWNRFVHNINI